MKLQPQSYEATYSIGDESGYKFTITAVKDNEFGSWSASVIMSSWGYATPEDAVKHLGLAAERFVKQIENLEKEDAPSSSDQG